MSKRTDIKNAIVTLLANNIDGTNNSNLYNNVKGHLVFYDEVVDFPLACVTTGQETREYKPGAFTWGFLDINIKVYVQDEQADIQLENIIEDIEKLVNTNLNLAYDDNDASKTLTDFAIVSINTDEGLLYPLGFGEIVAQVRYEV